MVRWVCTSIMPGMAYIWPRSMTLSPVSADTELDGATDWMVSPTTTMVWLSASLPVRTSRRWPTRTRVRFCGVADWAGASGAMAKTGRQPGRQERASASESWANLQRRIEGPGKMQMECSKWIAQPAMARVAMANWGRVQRTAPRVISCKRTSKSRAMHAQVFKPAPWAHDGEPGGMHFTYREDP